MGGHFAMGVGLAGRLPFLPATALEVGWFCSRRKRCPMGYFYSRKSSKEIDNFQKKTKKF